MLKSLEKVDQNIWLWRRKKINLYRINSIIYHAFNGCNCIYYDVLKKHFKIFLGLWYENT